MKTKFSVTLNERLVAFVDSLAGKSRSEKIEMIVRRYREATRDATLRRELAALGATNEDDAEAWRKAMENAQWNESGH